MGFFFRFVAGNPKNDLKQDSTYLSIEKYNNETESWATILSDNDWETELEWNPWSSLPWSHSSEAEIRWFVPKNQEPGKYRISHFGAYKQSTEQITQYSGTTNEFTVM